MIELSILVVSLLVVLSIAWTGARSPWRRHIPRQMGRQALKLYALNVGLRPRRWETKRSLRKRIRAAMEWKPEANPAGMWNPDAELSRRARIMAWARSITERPWSR